MTVSSLLSADGARGAAERVAGALRRRGAQRGDRVVLTAAGSPELVCAVLGATCSGVVPVMVNPGLLPHEQAYLVADSDPVAVIDDAALAALLDGPPVAIADHPLVRPMHYTSGTSGSPKGVFSGLLDETAAAALVADERDQWQIGPDDVYLAGAPLYHSAPLRFALTTLLSGGSVRVLDRFTADGFAAGLAAGREAGATSTFAAPAHLQRVFAAGLPLATERLRLVVHAGSACPSTVKEQAVDTFGADRVWEFYGSTEGQFTVCSTPEWQARPGTVGRARRGRVLHVEDDGVIWCQAPDFARFEYWRAPEKTAAAWRGDRFTVGDLGRLDDDGYLFIDGRREDLVITGGVNVYPAEVENALGRLPGVRQVAVFGVPDAQWGQRVCAAVVGDVTPEQVSEHARAALAGYKRPKSVWVVDALPHSANGKLLRRLLVEEYS